jgi:hypothetical protein
MAGFNRAKNVHEKCRENESFRECDCQNFGFCECVRENFCFRDSLRENFHKNFAFSRM